MSDDDLDKMLAEEAEHAEQHKDAEPGPETKVSRPNRNRSNVFSVRLSNDEMRRLSAAAAQAGIAPSTMARTMITKHLAESTTKYNRQFKEQMAGPIAEAQRQLSSETVKAAMQAAMQPTIQAAMQAAMQPTIQTAIRGFQEEAQKMLRQHNQEIQDIIRRATRVTREGAPRPKG